MTTNTAARKPSAATMRAALVRSGMAKTDAQALAPKALVTAFAALADAAPEATPAPAPATPAPAKAPAVKKAAPAPSNCGCGCGTPTVTAKARFLSGHDARFAGMVGRGVVPAPANDDPRMTPALASKIAKITETTAKKAAAKAAAQAAYDAHMAAANA